ncbi:GerMN domain-containing protein [Deinococcus misasensis]|uniref:GerMN domain-containing protein n=1 Tax=Deinococcus misasensis TaxID=392413 RepID=UPI00055626A6|nr:GerMN domain-containing protein [Deinococcus misasensis]
MNKVLTPVNIICLLLLAAAGIFYYVVTLPPKVPEYELNTGPATVSKNVRLYFNDAALEKYRTEERTIELAVDNETTFARTALKALMDGPKAEGSVSTLPKTGEVPDVFTREGHYYVNLPAAWKNQTFGSTSELLLVCTITRTLLDLNPNNLDVAFMVDGKTVESLAGHVDLRNAFNRESCP